MDNKILLWLKRAAASVLFLGYVPLMPGTVGSAVVVGLVWYFRGSMGVFYGSRGFLLYWVSICAGTALSIALSARPKETFGSDDPKQNIIDECVGQWITFFMVPITARTLILGFLLFRFFDVIKPYPVHKAEEIEGGAGIVLDDVIAGAYANIVMIAIVGLYRALHAMLVS
jgi:phosphatidylglycerophosphatase A